MTLKNSLYTIGIIMIMLVGAVLIYSGFQYALGAIDDEQRRTTESNAVKPIELFVATTTAATSTPFSIAGAKKVTFTFSNGELGGNFLVQVSPTDWQVTGGISSQGDDGLNANFIDFNQLVDNVTNDNSETITRVGFLTTVVATSTYSMDLTKGVYRSARCTLNVVDGSGGNAASSTCMVLIEY